MDKQFEIVFEGGDVITADLLEAEAPITCENFWNAIAEGGFDYNRRLIEHFGGGVMHFHCNRSDLAAEVARLKGLMLFQFGGDSRDGVPSVAHVDEMRRAVGEIPIMVRCELGEFRRLDERELRGNVWYGVTADEALTEDQANRLAEKVRAYRAPARAW
ncbi:MAG: hypothetical protein J7M14_07080 [Planctomycetes bacterium]|nr:hypothetical protein [Planctomycetota bacterium]